MTVRVVVVGCCVTAALLIAIPVRPGRRRLRRLAPTGPVARAGVGRAVAGPTGRGGRRLTRGAAAVLAGLSIGLVLGGWPGLAAGLFAAVVVDRAVRGFEPRAVRDAHRRAAEDLPLAADLLAAVLRAGAPVDRATAVVGEALGGPLGERLRRVSRALRLGATASVAWRHVSDVVGAGRLVSAAVRSSASGAALASAMTRLADDIRAARLTDQDAAARRAGVLLVLPLGLCYLPAFVLAGLVPVVVAVLDDVL